MDARESSASSGPPAPPGRLALVMLGGGARAAYQVGFLRCLARRMPDVRFPIMTGVSSGAINVAHLASRCGDFGRAVEELTSLWVGLTPDRVMRTGALPLFRNVLLWGLRLMSGGSRLAPSVRTSSLVGRSISPDLISPPVAGRALYAKVAISARV